jgi:predicted amidophosphoribosyltransferase
MSRDQRAANLRDAFWVDPRAARTIAGARVALVDDVVTTGATAQAAALALRRAGAAAVDLWVLARTPLDDD